MSEFTQEQRDEAARLMGWTEDTNTHPELRRQFWVMPNGRQQLKMAWKPDVNPAQAFMLRDRCVELGLKLQYTARLMTVVGIPMGEVQHWKLALANAEQITLAATACLKEHLGVKA